MHCPRQISRSSSRWGRAEVGESKPRVKTRESSESDSHLSNSFPVFWHCWNEGEVQRRRGSLFFSTALSRHSRQNPEQRACKKSPPDALLAVAWVLLRRDGKPGCKETEGRECPSHGKATSSHHSLQCYICFVAYVIPYQQLEKMAQPSYGDDGELLDGGFDMSTSGVCSYIHDVIYITSFVQLMSIISGKFWYTYLLIPAFAGYKLFGVTRGFMSQGSEGTMEDEKSRKKREKMEKKASRGKFVKARSKQGSAPTGGMLVEGATTTVIEMPQEVGQLVICYDMWEHLWILQILSDRLLGLAEMVPSLVSNRGVDLGHSLGFSSEEHMVAVPVGGCDGAADRRLQGRGAFKEADELNPMRVDGVAILHVEDEVLRDDGNWGMFMLAQIKLMATTMVGVCMTQMAKHGFKFYKDGCRDDSFHSTTFDAKNCNYSIIGAATNKIPFHDR
ncbi:hypothetical protein NE237_005625 [Protea cynaroides]|uniref:Transmembrane protein 208 n=1 Tax=Protea cynaroides TaxID=273540 RepID=A0A9Q0KLJ8_9MAGN|nr:hypothetical protein NE237_005625 [Protea cynaroides]